MKRKLLAIVLVICAFMSTGCSTLKNTPFQRVGDIISTPVYLVSERSHPERELARFVEALQEKDYVSASRMLSSQAKKQLTVEKLERLPYGPTDYAVLKVALSGKSNEYALIDYTFGRGMDYEAHLVREYGLWKIVDFAQDISEGE